MESATYPPGLPGSEESSRTIRVMLADGESLFRKAISNALNEEPDFNVVAEAMDGVQAVFEAARSRPDVVIMNADLPRCDGIEATRRVRQGADDCRVIVISKGDDHETLERAVEAGACGYLSQQCSLSDLIDATRAVSSGETTIPGHMLGDLLSRLLAARQKREVSQEKVSRLSRQEHTVLELLAQGHSNTGIAKQLTISPATARTHVQRILAKLEVHSRLEAAAYVRQSGVQPGEAI